MSEAAQDIDTEPEGHGALSEALRIIADVLDENRDIARNGYQPLIARVGEMAANVDEVNDAMSRFETALDGLKNGFQSAVEMNHKKHEDTENALAAMGRSMEERDMAIATALSEIEGKVSVLVAMVGPKNGHSPTK